MNSLLEQLLKDDFDERMNAGNSYFTKVMKTFFEIWKWFIDDLSWGAF